MRPLLTTDTHDHLGFPANADLSVRCPDEVFDYLYAMEQQKKYVVINSRYKIRCLHAAEIRLGAVMVYLRWVNNLAPSPDYLEYLQREHEQLYGGYSALKANAAAVVDPDL